MQEVAKHLKDYALANSTNDKIDLFVKSACNRYYYHVYLELRDEVFNILDNSKRFEHGSKASQQIQASYKSKIRNKLISMELEAENDILNELVKSLIKKFTHLYDIREESDYNNPTVTITATDAKINFYKKDKECEYSLSKVEETANEIIEIIQELSTYRTMAGL